ncbi:NUDIX domain-containing protein [Microbacterium sp. 4R-513]|uniref:NUDIX hydrolase n=1 Tax=Microbacterium sp. 4R-513 TaxID=2567934 RepID=UPI001F49F2F5|nr:NUDIX domain-containing protein [Microbacterium sp. 4R-513]
MPPNPRRIRNIAVGLVVRDGRMLVEIYPATARHGVFARVPGGGIEFGETARQAVQREFVEELGIELSDAESLAITENIFESGGARGHEIVHSFAVVSPEFESLADDAELRVLDNHTTVRWVPLERLRADEPPLYPIGMLALAERLAEASRS